MERNLRVLQGYVDEVMHYMWDPIGVAGVPQARDEYDAYVPRAVSLLLQSDDAEKEVADYLMEVESERMGLVKNSRRAREVAAVLVDYRDWVEEQFKNLPQ